MHAYNRRCGVMFGLLYVAKRIVSIVVSIIVHIIRRVYNYVHALVCLLHARVLRACHCTCKMFAAIMHIPSD